MTQKKTLNLSEHTAYLKGLNEGKKKRVIEWNPKYNPKPITEGEVWQGHPLFPNELRDESEKPFIIRQEED